MSACRCRSIFSIQQCLTNITSNRESDLDHARQYYELLYLPPDVSLQLTFRHNADRCGYLLNAFPFSALTLMVWRLEGHPDCKTV